MRITVSNATREMLAARSPTGQLSERDSTCLPDGRWQIDIDDDLAHVLAAIDPDPETAICQALAGGHA